MEWDRQPDYQMQCQRTAIDASTTSGPTHDASHAMLTFPPRHTIISESLTNTALTKQSKYGLPKRATKKK